MFCVQDKDEGDKDKHEKKRDKTKYFTERPGLLLAFVYFDQTHTGYLLDKDVEEIIYTLGLQLSRAQVHFSLILWSSERVVLEVLMHIQ